MIKLYKSESQFRDAIQFSKILDFSKMIDHLQEYYEMYSDEPVDFENIKTGAMVKCCLKLGRYLIDEQIDYGVVHVSKIDGDVTTFGMLD
jgi:hypothetical protein